MFVTVKCSSCNQSFDYDSSLGLAQVECPHCGRTQALAPVEAPQKLTVQHNAPNLSGAQACPACKAQIARDAVLCIHCGYNLKTRRKAEGSGSNKGLFILLGAGLVVVAIGAAYLLWPASEPLPPPVATSAAQPAVAPAAVTAAAPAPTAPVPAPVTNEPAPAAAPAEPVAPPPPPAPTADELAAQKAAADKAAFEAKKIQAEQNLRLQLASREPLYKVNEPVELRRKNGVVDKGTLTSFSGTGTDRVVLVATPTGEVGIPLIQLDGPSRRRVDPEYREAFIQHVLGTQVPGAPPAGTGP